MWKRPTQNILLPQKCSLQYYLQSTTRGKAKLILAELYYEDMEIHEYEDYEIKCKDADGMEFKKSKT